MSICLAMTSGEQRPFDESRRRKISLTCMLIIKFARSYPRQSLLTLLALILAGIVEGIGMTALLPLLQTAINPTPAGPDCGLRQEHPGQFGAGIRRHPHERRVAADGHAVRRHHQQHPDPDCRPLYRLYGLPRGHRPAPGPAARPAVDPLGTFSQAAGRQHGQCRGNRGDARLGGLPPCRDRPGHDHSGRGLLQSLPCWSPGRSPCAS